MESPKMENTFWRRYNMNDHEPSAFRYFEDSIGLRQSTLQEVLEGSMNPIERRAKIVKRRRDLLFGRPDIGASSATIEIESDDLDTEEESEATESEPDTSEENERRFGVAPLNSVEVTAESPSNNEIRAANAVATNHPDAESVVLSDRIRVTQSPGNWFELKTRDVMERELGIVDDTESPEESIPSMSEAAEW